MSHFADSEVMNWFPVDAFSSRSARHLFKPDNRLAWPQAGTECCCVKLRGDFVCRLVNFQAEIMCQIGALPIENNYPSAIFRVTIKPLF